MSFRSAKDLKLILHPYLFVLKEGAQIQHNYLDYSLMMLQVTSPEIIRSPSNVKAATRSIEPPAVMAAAANTLRSSI